MDRRHGFSIPALPFCLSLSRMPLETLPLETLTLNPHVHPPHQRCTYCQESLTQSGGDGFCHPFWIQQEAMCRHCCQSLPMCAFCERRTTAPSFSSKSILMSKTTLMSSFNGSGCAMDGGVAIVGQESNPTPTNATSHPIHICQACSSLRKIRSADLSSLSHSVMRFLTSITGIPFESVLVPVRVRLAGIHDISMISSKRTKTCLFTGPTQMEQSPMVMENLPATTFGVCVCRTNAGREFQQNAQRIPTSRPSSASSFAPKGGGPSVVASPKWTIDILLLRGLSLCLAGAFLAHELIHAILHCLRLQQPPLPSTPIQQQIVRRDMTMLPFLDCDPFLYEEGLCHLAAASWLAMLSEQGRSEGDAVFNNSDTVSDNQQHAHRQMQFWLKKFFYGQHPEFSVGFKVARERVGAMGWIGAIQMLIHGETQCRMTTFR